MAFSLQLWRRLAQVTTQRLLTQKFHPKTYQPYKLCISSQVLLRRFSGNPFLLAEGNVKTTVTPYEVKRETESSSSSKTAMKEQQATTHYQKMTLLQRVNIPMSHRKMNIVAKMLRGIPLAEAEAQVAVLNKKAARYLSPLLLRVKEKAVLEDKRDIDRLKIGCMIVNQGPAPKRIVPWHGKGRYGIRKTYSCHVTVGVCEIPEEELPQKKPKVPNRFPIQAEPRRPLPELPKPWLLRSYMDLGAGFSSSKR